MKTPTPTPGATSYFYQVDLGQNDHINRVQVHAPHRCRSERLLATSIFRSTPDDGAGNPAATPSFSKTTTAAISAILSLRPTQAQPRRGRNGRFVSITRLDNSFWLTFAEMEVIGSSTPLQYTQSNNIAAGKAVTMSSPPGFGALPASGNDGNISGDFNDPSRPVYHSSNHSVGEFWQVDLGANIRWPTPSYLPAPARIIIHERIQVSLLDGSMNVVDSVIVDNSDVNGTDARL